MIPDSRRDGRTMDKLILLSLFIVCHAAPVSERSTTTAPYAENVSARPGENVTLPCQVPANNTLLGAKWTRTDLGEEYVVLFLHGHMETENQHSSFKNRTEMQSSQFNRGNLSVVLNNVRTTDSGTYTAYQMQNIEGETKDISVCIVHLMTTPG
ncbi:programmed cell death 1 ligand 1-like [Scomber japonicus]|uniref:programmed cell death 1 ligand 1-like n=1 Tax=Scomber japonicus TaxID=13676 RepID=UPI002305F61A|nr:programmed cell death 1 ligand 1-like [Scomber japonicus]